MLQSSNFPAAGFAAAALVVALSLGGTKETWASDHFDSPAMVANPQADIADIYAWTAADNRLNLVMTIVGHSFSDRITYAFHVDSGKVFGQTTASTLIVCRFPGPKVADCQVGEADSAHGDATGPAGLEGKNHRFRVFAGLRDDPFYNNVKGSLGAYGAQAAAVKAGAVVDKAGCAQLDPSAAKQVAEQWRHTDGGPATNLLANWTASAIVISLDLDVVNKGGNLLAVWGSTASPTRQIDRMARPYVGNTLLGASPFSTDQPSADIRDRFDAATPATSGSFAPMIEKGLAMQDSLDGKCGNQLLAGKDAGSSTRYSALARVFADDRLWVNSASQVCTQFFAVELASLAGRKEFERDCGGRSPVYDTPNQWRSLLVDGRTDGIHWDGLSGDEHPPSATVFPFLAPPDPHGIDH
ncbi:hypothetical protein ACVWWJ_001947 [Luteibacter sp. HA06]